MPTSQLRAGPGAPPDTIGPPRSTALPFTEHSHGSLRTFYRRTQMFCTKCGVQLREDDRFCSQCGSRTGLGRIVNSPRALMLDKRNRKIAGVCAGFARYLEVDVILIRVLWLAVAITTGVGFLAYIAAWLIMPSDRGLEMQMSVAPTPQAG